MLQGQPKKKKNKKKKERKRERKYILIMLIISVSSYQSELPVHRAVCSWAVTHLHRVFQQPNNLKNTDNIATVK